MINNFVCVLDFLIKKYTNGKSSDEAKVFYPLAIQVIRYFKDNSFIYFSCIKKLEAIMKSHREVVLKECYELLETNKMQEAADLLRKNSKLNTEEPLWEIGH